MKLPASWRTSLFGAGGTLTVIVSALNQVLDGNPHTNPDWNIVVAALMASIGLFFARDNVVSSEAAGAKTDAPPA